MNRNELQYLQRRLTELAQEREDLEERVRLLWQEHDAEIHDQLVNAREQSPTGAVRFALRYGGDVDGYPINNGGTAAVWVCTHEGGPMKGDVRVDYRDVTHVSPL